MRRLAALIFVAAAAFAQTTVVNGWGGSGTSGTVTTISAPSSIFSIANPTTTPALSYATGQTANRVFGTDASGNVGSFALTRAMLPTLLAADIPASLSSTTTVNGTSIPSSGTLTQTIASGTSALGTSAISSGACATVVTTSATGTATTDVIAGSFNADPTAVTGYSPTTSGMLTIIGYPTASNVNWKVCNNTSASITPGAITLNWRVTR
jgi:hypothetical protein